MQQYRDKQTRIYDSFRHQMEQDTLNSQCTIKGVDAGFLVVLKYDTTVTDAIGKLSSSVNLALPSIEYGAHNIHTTLLTGPKIAADASEEDIQEQWDNLKHWFDQQGKAIANMYLEDVRIDFSAYLYNSNSLIAASEGNDAFWQLAETLMTAANLMGQPLNMPWGSHVTVSRFLQDDKNLQRIATLIKCAPQLQEATPVDVQLVRFECDKRGFRFMAD